MMNKILQDKVKRELTESMEDQIVKELRKESSFDEKFIRKRFRQLTQQKNIRDSIFSKLTWEERNYFVNLCSERDYMDGVFRKGFDKIENRLKELEVTNCEDKTK